MEKALRILSILKASKGYVSGEYLSKELRVSREAIWKSISLLRRYGYDIQSKKGKGYMLKNTSRLLLAWEIKDGLNTRFIGKDIIHKDVIDSTQDLALRIADKAKEGTIIIAEEQRKGRGRLGRAWIAPRGGIWFSLILKPKLSLSYITLLPLTIGLGVADALKSFGLDAKLKWPNDVMIKDKKVAGILLDVSSEIDAINYAIIGIGINANVDIDYLKGLRATSIKHELGYEIDRIRFMQVLLKAIEDRYMQLYKDRDGLLEEYKRLCITLNSRVKVTSNDEQYNADAIEIDSDGSLIVMLDNNTIRRVHSGDVSISND